MRKIGLYGGSFNPIHDGHIEVIQEILDEKLVDEIWIVPCKNHAFNKELASAEDRINMINLALKNKNIQNVKIDYTEISSHKKNYTSDSVAEIKKQNPDKEFYFIVGTDVLHEFDKWHKSCELLKAIKFIICPRSSYPFIKISGMSYVKVLDKIHDNISSTQVRENVLFSKPLKNLVSPEVEEYILKNGLYREN